MKKRSKYINARYFFVVDKVEKKEVRIVYCSTEEMVADFSTKPIQGIIFTRNRNTILGILADKYILYKRLY